MDEYDITIIGGGLIGLSLCQLLSRSPLRINMIESSLLTSKSHDEDTRTLVLSPSSQQLLQAMNLWSHVESIPMEGIHISSQGYPLSTRIHAHEVKLPYLGYAVRASQLKEILYKSVVLQNHITVINPAEVVAIDAKPTYALVHYRKNNENYVCKTRLVVASDGSQSNIRKWMKINSIYKRFSEEALTATIVLKRQHDSIAYERFQRFGPMALLPIAPHKMGLVWCLTQPMVSQVKHMVMKDQLNLIQQEFGYRVGKFIEIENIKTFPLEQVYAHSCYAQHVVCIGNAYHTLHPVAAQGLNLGWRDVSVLSAYIQQSPVETIGTIPWLQAFEQMRRYDHDMVQIFTNTLLNLYKSKSMLAVLLRLGCMLAVDRVTWIKKVMCQYTTGLYPSINQSQLFLKMLLQNPQTVVDEKLVTA